MVVNDPVERIQKPGGKLDFEARGSHIQGPQQTLALRCRHVLFFLDRGTDFMARSFEAVPLDFTILGSVGDFRFEGFVIQAR